MRKLILPLLFLLINNVISLNIECEYGTSDSQYAHGDKYRCLVKNEIIIDFPEEVNIENITGTHMSCKSNDNDIHLHFSHKTLRYFPRGMEKIYKNLIGIFIWHTQLKEIHQEDLKPYPKLNNIYLHENKIEVIEDGLFDYNPDIEIIIFEKSSIFHIGANVFDDLSKMIMLFFNQNICTNLYSSIDRAAALKIARGVKVPCTSKEFLSLKKKLENLEEMSKIPMVASSQGFSQSVINFQTEFEDSKFASFSPLKERYQKFIESLTKSVYGDSCSSAGKNLKVENQQDDENSQQSILAAVDSKIEELESRLTTKIEDILDEKLDKVMTNMKKVITML